MMSKNSEKDMNAEVTVSKDSLLEDVKFIGGFTIHITTHLCIYVYVSLCQSSSMG